MFADEAAALDWLYGTQLFGIKLGLASMERLVDTLELPSQKIIHVAGTNGKGSTCAMIASMAQAAGIKTGLFTSPHLISFRERIRINGLSISGTEIQVGLNQLRRLVEDWDPHPTFFELTTALALWHFARHQVELIVLETGMGGRLDATNVVRPLVSVITPIGLDHQQWLGQTIAEIAREKAGIIKPPIAAISAPQTPEAAAVLQAAGGIKFISEPYTASPLALTGAHQQWNAALGIAALRTAGFQLDDQTIATGLAQTQWPARFQQIRPEIIIDGAHNPAGAEVLRETWMAEFPERKAHLIFGAVAAKDVHQVLETLRPISASIHFVTLQSPRAIPAMELLVVAQKIDPNWPATIGNDAESVLASLQSKTPLLITGSLYLCGEALAYFEKNAPFEVSAQ
jgi:dihydrofolate synthase / folylpolyglutamate synthase